MLYLKDIKKNILPEILIIFLSFYFSLATCFYVRKGFPVFSMLVMFIIAFVILNLVYPKIVNIKLKKTNQKFEKKELLIYGVIIFGILLFTFLAMYPLPEFLNVDTVTQWEQVQSGVYENWHPVIHTLIFFKLPSLFWNNIVACAIFQLIFIGSILLYFCYFLRKYFLDKKGTIISLLIIILNPSFIKMSLTLLKDAPFSWLVFLGTLFFIELVLTKGKWIDKTSHKVSLIILSLGIMLIRHNGLANILVMFFFLALVFKDKRRFYIITCISLVAFRFILYGPVYDKLGIVYSKNIEGISSKAEMLGVPCNQIAYLYHKNIKFDKEDQRVLDELAPKGIWEKYYYPSSFNPMKYNYDLLYPYSFVWMDKNFDKIIKMCLKYSVRYPKYYVKSYLNVTSPIWKITNGIQYKNTWNTKGYDSSLLNRFRKYYNSYSDILSSSPLKYLFCDIGVGLFIIIFSLTIVIYKRKKDIVSYLPFTIVLSNTFVIMLLITAASIRLVYSQIICSLPLLIYALSLKEEKNNTKGLFYKYFIAPTENSLLQFIRYGFVGGIAAVVNIGMLYILTNILKNYIIANILSFTMGLIVNYVLSKKFVFSKEVEVSKLKEFLIYAVIGVVGLIFDTLLLWLFTDKIGIYYMVSKILSTIIVFVWNFVARKILYKIVR